MNDKKCRTCGKILPYSSFSKHDNNNLRLDCKSCRAKKVRENNHANGIKKPMDEAKNSPVYLGVYIAERVLSTYFESIIRMPYGNPGYDYICSRGYKIDVKSSCLSHGGKNFHLISGRWEFCINKNSIADYFLCLAFDNRESLEPQHVWLIPGNIVKTKNLIMIGNTQRSLGMWSKYERPLEKVITCCSILRGDKN